MSDTQPNYACTAIKVENAESYLETYMQTKDLKALQNGIDCLREAIKEGYPKNEYIIEMYSNIVRYLNQEASENNLHDELMHHFKTLQIEVDNNPVDEHDKSFKEYYYHYVYETTLYELEQELFLQPTPNIHQQQEQKRRIRSKSLPLVLIH